MKKFLLSVICAMVLVFIGCEFNIPSIFNNVVTGAAKDVTTSSVVLHGEVNISTYDDVEFGIMVSEVKDDLNNRDGEMFEAKVLVGNEFKLELTNLSPKTEYYYCAWVFLNNTQYEFGNIKSFTTLEAPVITSLGAFSVSADKQVTISKGNLQYTQSTSTWSFAEHQWDYIGTDNVTGGSVTSYPQWGDNKNGDALADKIDLFGWSTNSTNYGVSTSTDYNDYSGSFVDWGNNKIGDDAANTWRTLTFDEWNYLRNGRPNASSLCGVARVNGVNGLIFLPDNWTCPEGITFKSGFHSEDGVDYYAAYQTFTTDQWSKLEFTGAVFLPATGNRDGTNVRSVQHNGNCYWSATEYNSLFVYCLRFGSVASCMGRYNRSTGYSVRLVKEL